MNEPNLIAALDIGASQMRLAVATCQFSNEQDWQNNKSDLEIIHFAQTSFQGMFAENGDLDVDIACDALETLIHRAQLPQGLELRDLVLNFSSQYTQQIKSIGVAWVKKGEVDEQASLDALASCAIGPWDKKTPLISAHPTHYGLDFEPLIPFNSPNLYNPQGLLAKRLELKGLLWTGNQKWYETRLEALKSFGFHPKQFGHQALAVGDAFLSLEQKQAGVVLINIGHYATDAAIYHQGVVIDCVSTSVAGLSISLRLAKFFSKELHQVEDMKQNLGLSSLNHSAPDTLDNTQEIFDQEFERTYGDFLNEIFSFVVGVIEGHKLNVNDFEVVFTGGVAQTIGFESFASNIFGNCKVLNEDDLQNLAKQGSAIKVHPQTSVPWVNQVDRFNQYTTLISLLYYAQSRLHHPDWANLWEEQKAEGGFWRQKVAHMMKYIKNYA